MTVGAIITAIISASFLAAIVSALVTMLIARKKSLEEERARVRTIYAEAYQAVAAYKELPYAIRRRGRAQPEAERLRLSEDARKIQERLSYYRAWTQAESEHVGQVYAELVNQLRVTAGGACQQAWEDDPVSSDAEMNIGTGEVNLAAITPYEDSYITAFTIDIDRRRTWKAALPRKTPQPKTLPSPSTPDNRQTPPPR